MNLAQEAWSRSANALEKENNLKIELKAIEPSPAFIEFLETDASASSSSSSRTSQQQETSLASKHEIEVETVPAHNVSLSGFLSSAFHREDKSEHHKEKHVVIPEKAPINLDPIQ